MGHETCRTEYTKWERAAFWDKTIAFYPMLGNSSKVCFCRQKSEPPSAILNDPPALFLFLFVGDDFRLGPIWFRGSACKFPPLNSGTPGRANICVSICFCSVTGLPPPTPNYNVDSSGGDPRTPALAIVFAQLCVWGKGGRTPSGSLSIAEGSSLTKQDSEEC